MSISSFLHKHWWSLFSQLFTLIVAIAGFTWVAGAQVERTNQVLTNLDNRVGKIEKTLDSMHTLDLRVTRLEEGLLKTGDIVSRLERAVVRLEALAE